MTATEQENQTELPAAARAVLYVCVEQGRQMPTLATERAKEEGKQFATSRGLTIVDTITDPYGEPEPLRRAGWTRVRGLAEGAEAGTAIVRWPAAIAPEGSRELRHREIRWLHDHGVHVCYSWEPLARGGEAR
ncbi:hypothetical protein [Streptomyces sp. NPDC054794]